jgi:hypothetical protein
MKRIAMAVLWPSFLVAIVAEGFFFSILDPHLLHLGESRIEMTAAAIYTVGFFCFWLFCILASSLSCYLLQAPDGERSKL